MYSYGPPHMAKQKQDDQLEHTYSSYVRTQDVTLKTCQRRWIIGRSGERESGISVLAAQHDDNDNRHGLFPQCKRHKITCAIHRHLNFLIIIIKSNWQYGIPWLFLAIHSYHLSLLIGLLDILCPYRADVCKSLLVKKHWCVHM